MAGTEESTDGNIQGWPCCVAIIGDNYQGFELSAAPYTVDDESAPFEIGQAIEACQGVFKKKAQARAFALLVCGFVPDTEWGEMES